MTLLVNRMLEISTSRRPHVAQLVRAAMVRYANALTDVLWHTFESCHVVRAWETKPNDPPYVYYKAGFYCVEFDLFGLSKSTKIIPTKNDFLFLFESKACRIFTDILIKKQSNSRLENTRKHVLFLSISMFWCIACRAAVTLKNRFLIAIRCLNAGKKKLFIKNHCGCVVTSA